MPDDLEPGELYVVVRRGVRDALWDVLADLFSLLIAVVLFVLGVQLLVVSLSGGVGLPAIAGAGVGLVLVGLAAFEIYRTFYR